MKSTVRTDRPTPSRRRIRIGLLALLATLAALLLPLTVGTAAHAVTDPCGTGSNPIVCENSKPGTPMSDWFSPNAWGDIQGFSAQESVTPGSTIQFKIQSPVSYHVEIYRLGYYGGDGAREMSTAAQAAQTYPANYTTKVASCTSSATTGLVDCGSWPVTASWTVPSDAVSGLYIANFDQTDGNGLMPYPFVVRDDSSHSALVVQTSDETWQAYNMWGGQNLYQGNGPAPDGRAYQVSYNRPLDIGGDNGVYGSEYEMISWLEQNGYDASYVSGLDVSTNGSLLLNHKVFMSDGHDEYWNQAQYDNVLAARKAGVNEAFFSGNEVFWKTRLAPSVDSTNTPNRTLVCYKMTKLEFPTPDGVPDPSGAWTGTWMDPASAKYNQPYEPENALTGSLFQVNGYRSDAITVPGSYAKLRIWRNTSVASLTPAQTAVFPTGTLGYEWDSDVADASRPSGEIDLSSTTVDVENQTLREDWGNLYGNGNATHSLVEFRDPTSHALVFGSATVQWSWGLTNVPTTGTQTFTADARMQQATVNILADMGLQPVTLQSGLVAASASTDTVGPTATVTSPSGGSTVPALRPVTITGTAADNGGGVVARVEVSTDGGNTWNPATGLTSWSYSWTPTAQGSAQVQVRAEDDSANIGAVTTLSLTVGPQQCPCTVFPASAVPGTVNSGDGGAVELGVKFQTSSPGSITAVRFYKSTANTGTHTGNLWTASGQLLATGTFTNETASGWQQLNFASPVPVKPNTTYVASYFAPSGGYSYDGGYFSNQSAGLAPLTAPQSGGASGGNGVYHYGSTSAFPSTASNGSNYWVDVVLDTSTASTTPPSVTAQSPTSGATGVSITSPVSATFSESVDQSTLTFTVKDPKGSAVPGTAAVTSGNVATFTPSSQLALNTVYTASVQVSDLWGNAMTAPVTWTFTTSTTPPATNCPCALWPSTAVPGTPDTTADPNSLELGARFQAAEAGNVTGVTFYKGTGNTGTHTGSLWSSSGTLLATGTFTNETASGWQTLTFASPVAISANTTYVVSYHAPHGNYAADEGYFSGAHLAYPLTAPADASGAPNGVYTYGSTSAFPTGSSGSANYWVSPVFSPSGTSGVATRTAMAGAAAPLTAAAPGGLVLSAAPLSGSGKGAHPTGANRIVDATHPLTATLPATTDPATVDADISTTPSVGDWPDDDSYTAVVGYNPATHQVSLRPAGPLAYGVAYRITLTAADQHGHQVAVRSWLLSTGYPRPHLPHHAATGTVNFPKFARFADWTPGRLEPGLMLPMFV
ncbi:DUF4082 domain-containing protein [Streptacidiphilus neutrinimicus]|uniref:DUF4082 domain-containing protein n=1 Tax=Streptacidiphilus neutrinimicus TaxID=105420 RepID=UPI0007C76603|nr:DUF4082 domain-containing protein [Streptacidiphilus neutrinimicus]